MKTTRFLLMTGAMALLTAALPLRAAEEESPQAKAIRQAQEAMAANNSTQARELLETARKADPKEPYLLYNIGVTFYAEGNLDTAQEWFQRADLEAKEEELRALILAQLGNIEAHRGRDALGENKELALAHFRRAHQVYQASLTRDSSQKIAQANHAPTRDGIVVLIVGKAKKQIEMANTTKRLSTAGRIDRLMTTRTELDEALQLDPDHDEAKKLKGTVDGMLVENLINSGDEKIASAKEAMGQEKSLDKALDSVMAAENSYRDALMIEPESQELQGKLAAATKLSSKILTELGKKDIAKAEDEKLAPKQVERLQTAINRFDQAIMADPDNQEAEKLKTETEDQLAERFEAAGDAEVANAEKRPETPEHVARHRERANDAFTNAATLNPDDPGLQEKQKDNAIKLAEALEQTGNKQLDEGEKLLEENPGKAVATLEQALDDFTKGSQLMQEHGESDAGMQEGMSKAGEMMEGKSEEGGQQPGEEAGGSEPGEGGSEQGEEGGAEPGEGEGSQPGEGEGSQPGEQPGSGQPGESQPGQSQPGQGQPGQPVPGGPSQANLDQGAQKAMELLQQARMAVAEQAAAESMSDQGGKGTPSYESVAYVMGGSDFNNEEGGGSTEVEGNFNTEEMNRPVRDW